MMTVEQLIGLLIKEDPKKIVFISYHWGQAHPIGEIKMEDVKWGSDGVRLEEPINALVIEGVDTE